MFTNCSTENSTNCTQHQLTSCSNRNFSELQTLTLARGITSAVCCFIWVIVLVVLLIFAKCYYQRACGTCVKHLTFGLTVSTILLQCFLTLSLVQLTITNEMNTTFCKADSFLFPYFQGLQFLFVLEICIVLIFKVLEATPWKCTSIHEKIKEWKAATFCDCKTLHKKTKESTSCWFVTTVCGYKLEFAVYATTIILPVILSVISFTTCQQSYGSVWCEFCRNTLQGQVAGIVLRDVLYALVALLIILLFTASLCLLCFVTKDAKFQNLIKTAGVIDFLSFLIFLVLVFSLDITEAGIQAAALSNNSSCGLWISYAVITPFSAMFIPLPLLVAIHLPLSFLMAHTCRKHPQPTHKGSEIATFRRSSRETQPSHTTFDSPHSSYLESVRHVLSGELHDYKPPLPKIEEENNSSTAF